ncbi:hypothetical protein BOTBODRAFT_182229, partial [Botryobasidium botryosum FD-172 SS1]
MPAPYFGQQSSRACTPIDDNEFKALQQRLNDILSLEGLADSPAKAAPNSRAQPEPTSPSSDGEFERAQLQMRQAIAKAGGAPPGRSTREKYQRNEQRLADALANAERRSPAAPGVGASKNQARLQPVPRCLSPPAQDDGDDESNSFSYFQNCIAEILANADARSLSPLAHTESTPPIDSDPCPPSASMGVDGASGSDNSGRQFREAQRKLWEIVEAAASLSTSDASPTRLVSPLPLGSPPLRSDEETTDPEEFRLAYAAVFRKTHETSEEESLPGVSASEPEKSAGTDSVYEPPAPEYHGLNLESSEYTYSDGGDSLLGELGGISGTRARYLSSPDLWRQALGELSTLGGAQWLEQSVMNYYLLDVWFRLRTARGIYLDMRIAGLWGAEAPLRRYIGERVKPLLRRNFSLPAKGACPPQPVVFFVREEVEGVGGHFFTVVADVESRVVYTLGRWDDTPWDDWHGPKYYKHICSLFGWQGGRVSQVAVRSTPLRQNGYDCGPQAVAAAVHVMESGVDLEDSGQMRAPPVRCGHFIRLRMYRQLLSSCRESMELYESLLTSPPDEWQAASLGQIDFAEWFPPTQEHYDLVYAAGMEDDPVAQGLQGSIDRCSRCRSRPGFRLSLPLESKGMEGLSGMEDEGLDFDDTLDGEILDWDFEHADSPGGVVPDADMRVEDGDPSESDGDGPLGSRRQPGRLRILAQIRHNPTVHRFPRPTLPPDVPAPPAGPGLWLHHPPPFDDCLRGTEREDNNVGRPMEGQCPASRRFADYGYRCPPNFLYAFYNQPPSMVSDHVLALGLPKDWDPSEGSWLRNLTGWSLDRDTVPASKAAEVDDIRIVSLSEMIDLAGEVKSEENYRLFLRGRDEDERLVALDLEPDAVKLRTDQVVVSLDIDSLIFVTTHVKAKDKNPGIFLSPTADHAAPISKNNHVYVNLLLPPSPLDPDGPTRELRFPLSAVPQVRLAQLSEGTSGARVLACFPHAIHKNTHGFYDARVPWGSQVLFWERVILPCVARHCDVASTPYFATTVKGNTLRTATKGQPGGNLNRPKQLCVSPDVFSEIQRSMWDVVHSDPELAAFRGFFFVVDLKGCKQSSTINLTLDDTDLPESEGPLAKLAKQFNELDLDYMRDRRNGELYLDLAFSTHPDLKLPGGEGRVPLVGLWRQEWLEAS